MLLTEGAEVVVDHLGDLGRSVVCQFRGHPQAFDPLGVAGDGADQRHRADDQAAAGHERHVELRRLLVRMALEGSSRPPAG